jgi:methionine salvage enolase-phosphatase E1
MENEYFTESQLELIKEEFLNHIENDLYISLKTIFKWLNCANLYEMYINDKDFREHIYEKTIYKLENRERYYKMEPINDVNVPIFTIEGCKKFCDAFNYNSRYLGYFLTKIETKNKKNKYDTLVKTIEIMKKEINYLNREVDYLKQEVRNNRRD